MYDLSSPDFWIVAVSGLVIGLFFGWLIKSLWQRRADAGATVAQVRKEMEGYREEVNSHFATTAELFKETTEKYRDLYEHLAGGAQELADLPDRTRVEFKPGHLLAASVSPPVDLDEQATGPAIPKETVADAASTAPGEAANGADLPAATAADAVPGTPADSSAAPARTTATP